MSAIHDAFPHLLTHFPDPPQPGVFPFEDIFQVSLETQTSPPLNKVLLRDFVDILPLTCFDPRVVSDSELDAFLLTVHSRVLAEDWPPRFSNESKRWFREVFPLCRRDIFLLFDKGFLDNSIYSHIPKDNLIQAVVELVLFSSVPEHIVNWYGHNYEFFVLSFLVERIPDFPVVSFTSSICLQLWDSVLTTSRYKSSSRVLAAPNTSILINEQGQRLYVAPNAGHWKRWYEHITRSQADSGVLGVRDLIYQADGILNGDDELAKSYLMGWVQSVTNK